MIKANPKELKLINTTHIAKHCSVRDAQKIMQIIRTRITTKEKYGFCKTTRENGTVYYSKVILSFINIEKAIKALEEVESNPHIRQNAYDYRTCINILKEVREDRLDYGEMIPDTSDEYKTLYAVTALASPTRYNKSRIIASKKIKKKSFWINFQKLKLCGTKRSKQWQ